jgi:hypothetical protein
LPLARSVSVGEDKMHIGVGAALLILGTIYFMIISKGFRITVFVLAGFTIALFAYGQYNLEQQAKAKAKREAEAAAEIQKKCDEDKYRNNGKYSDPLNEIFCGK